MSSLQEKKMMIEAGVVVAALGTFVIGVTTDSIVGGHYNNELYKTTLAGSASHDGFSEMKQVGGSMIGAKDTFSMKLGHCPLQHVTIEHTDAQMPNGSWAFSKEGSGVADITSYRVPGNGPGEPKFVDVTNAADLKSQLPSLAAC